MKTHHIILILLFAIGSMSCSSDLSRNQARRILLNNKDAEYNTIDFEMVRESHLGYVLSGVTHGQGRIRIEDQLMRHGFIRHDLNYMGLRYFTLNDKIMQHVNEKGRYHNPPRNYHFKTAVLKDIEITGISGGKQHKRVECVFIYERNEIGKLLLDESRLRRNRAFNFSKFDDGWRLY